MGKKRKALDRLLDDLGLDRRIYLSYERLFIDSRSRYAPVLFPARVGVSEELLCDGCIELTRPILHEAHEETRKRLKRACEVCGAIWTARRQSSTEPFWTDQLRVTENRWFTPSDDRGLPCLREAQIARHLRGALHEPRDPLGVDFLIVSLRAGTAEGLPEELRDHGSHVLILDFDFKALWSAEEREAFEDQVQTRLGYLRIEAVLDDYEVVYRDFCRRVQGFLSVLPGEPIVFRSSYSHGIHAYVLLDRGYPSEQIVRRARGLLEEHGLSDDPILDQTIHPAPNATLRVPLGLGSTLLDPRTLRPMFEGSATDQLQQSLLWIASNEKTLRRIPIEALGQRNGRPIEPKEKKSFDPAPLLAIWKEGILRPGTRRRRTRGVIRLGLDVGCYGAELSTFVQRWLERRHNDKSVDVNLRLAKELPIDDLHRENDRWARTIVQRLPIRVRPEETPIPFAWLEEIVNRVQKLGLTGAKFFRAIRFAASAHALADYFRWRSGKSDPVISFAHWRSLHKNYARLRSLMIRTGLVTKARDESFDLRSDTAGTAAAWSFPLLDLPDRDRVGLHEGLLRLMPAIRGCLTDHHRRRVRKLGVAERRLPRWGSGRYAEVPRANCGGARVNKAHAETKWRSERRRSR